MENIRQENNCTIITPINNENPMISQESVNDCIRIAKINSLNKKIYNNCSNCSCPISDKTHSKCVPNGNYNASIMLVDAFPSVYESFTGCLTDEKGYLLNEVLKQCNVNRSDIYCTTMLKCYNVKDTNECIVKDCLANYFSEEILLIKPKKLILTNSAFQACHRYGIIPDIGSINYFTKKPVTLNNGVNTNIYVIYDMSNINNQQMEAFKQGLKLVFQ